MKKYKMTFALIMLLAIIISLVIPAGCDSGLPTAQPSESLETPDEETIPAAPPGAYALVRSKWSGGDLDFTKTDGTVIMGLDGTNGDVEITSATITAGTATALTITTATLGTTTASTITSTTNSTYNLGSSSNQWNSVYAQEYYQESSNITFPSSYLLVGTTDTQTLTNKTLTSPTITGATLTTANISATTATLASPTITGTLSNANVEMGSANITAGNDATSAISHSLGSTPTIMIATWQADPGGDGSLFISSANSTHIVIGATANSTNNCAIDYVLWITGE